MLIKKQTVLRNIFMAVFIFMPILRAHPIIPLSYISEPAITFSEPKYSVTHSGLIKRKVTFDKSALKQIAAEKIMWDQQHNEQARNRIFKIAAAKRNQKKQGKRRRLRRRYNEKILFRFKELDWSLQNYAITRRELQQKKSCWRSYFRKMLCLCRCSSTID